MTYKYTCGQKKHTHRNYQPCLPHGHYGCHILCFHLLTGRTPHAVGHGLILLMMGIMMPETCWDRKFDNKHRISCILLVPSLHLMFTMHGHKNLKLWNMFVVAFEPPGELVTSFSFELLFLLAISSSVLIRSICFWCFSSRSATAFSFSFSSLSHWMSEQQTGPSGSHFWSRNYYHSCFLRLQDRFLIQICCRPAPYGSIFTYKGHTLSAFHNKAHNGGATIVHLVAQLG